MKPTHEFNDGYDYPGGAERGMEEMEKSKLSHPLTEYAPQRIRCLEAALAELRKLPSIGQTFEYFHLVRRVEAELIDEKLGAK